MAAKSLLSLMVSPFATLAKTREVAYRRAYVSGSPFISGRAAMLLAAGDNDGLVPVESAKWGDYQGTVPADHMDEVGQIADLFNPAFDHKAFYLGEIRRMAALGF